MRTKESGERRVRGWADDAYGGGRRDGPDGEVQDGRRHGDDWGVGPQEVVRSDQIELAVSLRSSAYQSACSCQKREGAKTPCPKRAPRDLQALLFSYVTFEPTDLLENVFVLQTRCGVHERLLHAVNPRHRRAPAHVRIDWRPGPNKRHERHNLAGLMMDHRVASGRVLANSATAPATT